MRIKTIDINQVDIFQKSARVHPFWTQKEWIILDELKVEPVVETLRRYEWNCLRHVAKMGNNLIPKILLNFRPNGRRWLGRPSKRLLDEAETGLSRLNSWQKKKKKKKNKNKNKKNKKKKKKKKKKKEEEEMMETSMWLEKHTVFTTEAAAFHTSLIKIFHCDILLMQWLVYY